MLPDRIHTLGFRHYREIPRLIAACDAVVVPQCQTDCAEHQVPVKLFDAMASGCPIVSTMVGDIPKVLGGGSRGWLIEPDAPSDLARSLRYIISHQSEANKRCNAAREWFLNNASSSVVHDRLSEVISKRVVLPC
jgi:glycosyltransferase involved in cell wall biosynthesis